MRRIVLSLAVAAAAAAAAGGAPTAPWSAEIPRCQARQLRLSSGFYGEAAVQFTQTLAFRNVSSTSCRLAGWPRVRALDARGRPFPTRTRRVVQGPPGARSFRQVLLPPAGAASFDLYGADWNAGPDRPCPRTSALLVAPPGEQTQHRLRIRLPDCGLFFVAPLVAGARDRLAWTRVWRG